MMRSFPLLAALFMVLSPSRAAVPEIVAHRGASSTAPENTLAAFREAWKEQADGIELDIRLTADGRIVALHDGNTLRTTGVSLEAKDTSLEKLRALDAGKWKGEKWKGERVPTLEEVLAELPGAKTIYIEIKSGPEILPELSRVIAASGKDPALLRVIAFDFATLAKAKSIIPGVAMLWLVDGKKEGVGGRKIYPDLESLVAKAKAAGLDGLNLNQGFPLDGTSVALIRREGLAFAVWTVNRAEDARRLAAAGVGMIATDHPARLRAWLDE